MPDPITLTDAEPDAEPAIPGFARSNSTVLGILLAALSFGTAFLKPALPFNLDLVDGVILLLVVLGFTLLAYQRSPIRTLMGRCAPWIWLILVGTLLSLFGLGFPRWALIGGIRNLSAYITFFALAAAIAHHRKGVQWALAGYLAAIPIVVISLVLEGGYRPAGTFVNPNYTGNFLLYGILLIYFLLPRTWLTYVSIAFCLFGIYLTDSLGAFTMGVAVGGYLLWRNLGRLPPMVSAAVRVVLVFVAIVGFLQVAQIEVEPDSSASKTTTQHYQKSSERRSEIWNAGIASIPDDPLGHGPGAVDRLNLATGPSLHNDYLAYLVELSLVALVGAIGFFVVLWRQGHRMGVLRPFLIALAVGSVTREVLNFRHIWVALAIALVADMSRRVNEGDLPNVVLQVLRVRTPESADRTS